MPKSMVVHTPWGLMLLGEAAKRSGLPSRLIASRINDLYWTGYDAVTVPPGGKRRYWRWSLNFRVDGDRLRWEENAQPGEIPPYETCPQLEYLRYKREFFEGAREGEKPLSFEQWIAKTSAPAAED